VVGEAQDIAGAVAQTFQQVPALSDVPSGSILQAVLLQA
jgi:hypothetical protein